ncbi:helix-turn-helix transcriptional regulator [Cellulomonas telluris]|uniref:helix-turn-helix transcriptional regulator n=1 Tax=Cellulomonas telluris TaxID=2306636 RepID=UPI0010A86111|nr:helix-turn-helix transcriptional regulator [Cellulomonas telluris]
MIAGRDAERSALRAVLDAARAGRGGALLVSGEPGAGKSALLADAVDGVDGVRVLRVQGVESEAPLAFAALHRLLRPLHVGLSTLPPRQERALRAALGEADADDGAPADRFLVYLALLTLLSDAAAHEPTVVVVDDAHWLDEASREAVLFVARRVEGEHLAVLLAARDGTLPGAGLPVLELPALDAPAVRTLLEASSGLDVPSVVAERLRARTGGNALALVELADALDRETLAGRAPLPTELPLTDGVQSTFLRRYERLAPAARSVVLLVASDDSGDVDVVRAAARSLGADDSAFDAARQSGLLALSGAHVDLRHPLVRSAVYGRAAPDERRRAHAALADALARPQDADRRAWHRAAAAEGPDEDVVVALEGAARRSAAAGGHEAASAAWERAAELSVDADAHARRLQAAAAAAWTAGRLDRAGALADAALLTVEDPLVRADAALLRARVEWNTGSVQVAHRRLLESARAVAGHDAARAREAAMFAASLEATSHLDAEVDVRAFVGAPESADERCVADLLAAYVAIARHDWAEAVAAVRRAAAVGGTARLGLEGLLPNLALVALHVGLDDVALQLHERLLAEARDAGALPLVVYALTRRGAVDVATGRWDVLAAGAREALHLAEATGRPALTAMPLAWLALAAALRGDEDAPARLTALERALATGPLGTTEASVRGQLVWARAVLAGSPASALHHYAQMSHGFAERLVVLDRVESAVRAERLDLAQRWVAEVALFAEGTGVPWAVAAAEHGRALLAPAERAEAHFRRALDAHASSARRVDAARTHLAYGEWLRRARRRVDARAHLRTALQTFDDVGARRWSERAAQELRASGEQLRGRAPGAPERPALTPTERQVALLVAQGLPTREVAGRLFVSPRTVDFHLRNVFAKLGLTSRSELAHVDLS